MTVGASTEDGVAYRNPGVAVDVDLADAEVVTEALVASVTGAADRLRDSGDVLVLRTGRDDGTAAAVEEPDPFAAADVTVVNRWERALRRVERAGAVTVAVTEGRCRGPALELLLCADYRIAGTDATFRLPGEGAAWPGMLLHRLANQIGVGRTRSLALLRPPLDAVAARALGLVDEVVDHPWEHLAGLLPRLKEVSGPEWAIRRRLILEASESYDDALGAHLAACDRALRLSRRAGAG